MISEEKIKVIIADDNAPFCDFLANYLKKDNNIEILGIANTDEEEIEMIEKLKPEIVITDLVRNRKYTGADIIKSYQEKEDRPKFLILSADDESFVRGLGIIIDAHIEKPCSSYDIVLDKLKELKKEKHK